MFITSPTCFGHDQPSSWRTFKYANKIYVVITINTYHTRPAQKLSSYFEYLKNRSIGLDVTWQPVRGDLTAHPCIVTLPWG